MLQVSFRSLKLTCNLLKAFYLVIRVAWPSKLLLYDDIFWN